MAWTEERVEILKRLWAEGLSAAQIANKIGGVTRNAVIGKVHRLGLSGRATPAKPQRGRTAAEEAAAAASVPAVPGIEADLAPVISEPAFIAPEILDVSDKTTVSSIKKNMCKWPVGDPATDDFHFCGQPTAPGKSYCSYHARMAFQPPQRREGRRVSGRKTSANEKQRAVG